MAVKVFGLPDQWMLMIPPLDSPTQFFGFLSLCCSASSICRRSIHGANSFEFRLNVNISLHVLEGISHCSYRKLRISPDALLWKFAFARGSIGSWRNLNYSHSKPCPFTINFILFRRSFPSINSLIREGIKFALGVDDSWWRWSLEVKTNLSFGFIRFAALLFLYWLVLRCDDHAAEHATK